MPRNSRKTRCQIPGCRSWAMRGHSLCRSHRDDELGLRGGGAPRHNLNALKTGVHADPLPLLSLTQLAKDLVRDPDHLPDHLATALQSIHARTHTPYKTLVAFRKVLPRLLHLVVAQMLVVEVKAGLLELPPSERAPFLAAIQELPPSQRLPFLVATRERIRGRLPENALGSVTSNCSPKNRKTSTGTVGHRHGQHA